MSWINCLWDLQIPFGALVVPDEQEMRAIDDEIFGRSGKLKVDKMLIFG